MLTIGRTKELLNDSNINDKEAKEIRDVCYGLAELALEIWQIQNIKNRQGDSADCLEKIKTPSMVDEGALSTPAVVR